MVHIVVGREGGFSLGMVVDRSHYSTEDWNNEYEVSPKRDLVLVLHLGPWVVEIFLT